VIFTRVLSRAAAATSIGEAPARAAPLDPTSMQQLTLFNTVNASR
jgi:hypothetical protein